MKTVIMSAIYQCLKRDERYNPPIMAVVYEAKTEREAIKWLELNGGGIYRNLLHNFQFSVDAVKKIKHHEH